MPIPKQFEGGYKSKHFSSQTQFNDFIKKLELQAQETKDERLPLYHKAAIPNANLILDVGCGAGFVTRDIATLTPATIIAIDGSHQLLTVAQHTLQPTSNTHLIQADAHNLPFPTNTFDITTCNLLLMWVDHPQHVLNEMTRVTKTGGTVLATLEPDYGGKLHWPEHPTIDPIFAGDAIRKKGGDPHIGRKLRALFATAGLHTTIGISNNRIWTCDEDKHYYLHSRDYYIKTLKDAGIPQPTIDQWEYDYLKSLDEGTQLNFFPQFYAIGTKPKP